MRDNNPDMSSPRSFSLAEANALIPSLDQTFRRLEALRKEIGARANELERLGVSALLHEGPEPPEVVERRRILRERVGEFQSEMDKIEELGGILFDLDLGLVDFPSRLDGREVLLSWQFGEPAVIHYRTPGAELRERRRIRDADAPAR